MLLPIFPVVCVLPLISVSAWPDPHMKTQGEVWPLPQSISRGKILWTIDPNRFTIHPTSQCDIIDEAIKRYTARLKRFNFDSQPQDAAAQDEMNSLELEVEGKCPEDVPQFGMDESYKLVVNSSHALLRAAEVWGALRGLESFSQLVYHKSGGLLIREAIIKDFPRFPHRGVLLDTSRHFLSTNVLKANIDLMSQNKMNVFHWHLVDNEAFPYASEALPSLSHGAYSPLHKYSLREIKDIIAYARLRGVRVMPEFDTPGHMQSWGKGMDGLLTRCFDKMGSETESRAMIDPTSQDTWDALLALFEEVFDVFPDKYVHLGGDEAQFWIEDCWEHNKNITAFMSLYGLNTTRDLEEWYFDKLINMLSGPRRTKKNFLVWQEVLDLGIEIENAIAHVWKSNPMKEMADVTAKGHYAILSSCWYLDHISTGPDWWEYYDCDPQAFNGSQVQKNLVLGGEAALWGEFVDSANVVSRLWPRASAVAERLWSDPANTKDHTGAWPRMYEMQCRMASRGYPVQPVSGPGFCEFEYQPTLPV